MLEIQDQSPQKEESKTNQIKHRSVWNEPWIQLERQTTKSQSGDTQGAHHTQSVADPVTIQGSGSGIQAVFIVWLHYCKDLPGPCGRGRERELDHCSPVLQCSTQTGHGGPRLNAHWLELVT